VLTLLGVLRAGLIAMPLPLLWRRAEAVAALSHVAVNALVVSGRIGTTDHYDLAMQIGAEIFPVRYICGYGGQAPDGVVSFDDLFAAGVVDPAPSLEDDRAGAPGPAAHLAVITWDVGAEGPIPVARSHAELIAGGLAVALESAMVQDPVLLSTLAMSSFASLAVAVVPWLVRGGTLVLHQPFDTEVFLAQLATIPCDTIIAPGPLATQLTEAGRILTSEVNVVGVWRAPERMARAVPWSAPKARMVDVQVFGEIGLVAARRGLEGTPAEYHSA
jgi:hypothetical protein